MTWCRSFGSMRKATDECVSLFSTFARRESEPVRLRSKSHASEVLGTVTTSLSDGQLIKTGVC